MDAPREPVGGAGIKKTATGATLKAWPDSAHAWPEFAHDTFKGDIIAHHDDTDGEAPYVS